MNRVDGFSTYQNNYYAAASAAAKEKGAPQADAVKKNDAAEQTGQVKLSQEAKNLLEELKKTYGNADFMVAEYETDEEAASYLSRGTKEYSVLLDPETLEKMAADEATKQEYLNKLDESMNQLSNMKEQLGDEKDEVSHIGITIHDDGTTSYFAELEKTSEKQKERIEQSRENRKEEKAKEAKKLEEKQRTRVSADSVEELMEKIRNVDWDQIKPEQVPTSGSHFDYSI